MEEEAELCVHLINDLSIINPNAFHQLPVAQQQSLESLAEKCIELSKKIESLSPDTVRTTISSFSSCVLRSLPPPVNPIGKEYDPEEDEPIPNLCWPILSLHYFLLMRALEEDPVGCKHYVSLEFVGRLLALLDGEDPREREAVKTLIHRIYGAFLQLRAGMRKSMQTVLLESVHSPQTPHKLSELLEIFGSIVNGFAVPVRAEHIQILLQRCLLPLHTLDYLSTFFPQLAYCIVQFVEKDASLGNLIIRYIVRHWPKSNSLKQVLLLGELEEIMDRIVGNNYAALDASVKKMVFDRMAECIASAHFQVAERALLLWSNEHVVAYVTDDRQVLAKIVKALGECQQRHWNKSVQALSLGAISTISQMDPLEYNRVKELNLDQRPGEDGRSDGNMTIRRPSYDQEDRQQQRREKEL